jgi:hypothetical protein
MIKNHFTRTLLRQAYDNLTERAKLDLDFLLLTVTASGICALGFEMNSASVIVGAMVISPLLYPVICIGATTYQRDWASCARHRHICNRRIGRDRRRRCDQSSSRGHVPIGDRRSIGRGTGGLFPGGAFLRHCRNLCVLLAENTRGHCRNRHLGRADPAGRHAGYRAGGTKRRSVAGQRDDCPVQRYWNLFGFFRDGGRAALDFRALSGALQSLPYGGGIFSGSTLAARLWRPCMTEMMLTDFAGMRLPPR